MENHTLKTKRSLSVVSYDPNWPEMFKHEQLILTEVLAECVVQIDHIGSTSVPHLEAKPIIDILIEVSTLTAFDDASTRFNNSSYELKGENGISGRRYIQKGGNNRSHHIHVFETGDDNLLRHRVFAKYLQCHPKIAKEYGLLKREAARKSKNDIKKYIDFKHKFIQHHEKLALKWNELTG